MKAYVEFRNEWREGGGVHWLTIGHIPHKRGGVGIAVALAGFLVQVGVEREESDA